MRSAVDGPPAAGCSDTLAIRCSGMWPGPSEKAPPVDLIAGQDAVADQVPGLPGHALVVVADAGQAVLGGPVAGDVHDARTVLQLAQLVRGGERGAGVGGLVT